MAKTVAQLNEQIAKLQREADALHAKEVSDVVARIREAIGHYGLTPTDPFDKPRARKAKAPDTVAAPRKRAGAKAAGAKARKSGVVKYRDESGNSWTGHGKRPNWFKAALQAGKTPEDLAVNGA